MKRKGWLCLLLLIAIACHKDDDRVTNDDLWVYANRFFDEAASRNVTLDKSQLTIKYVDASEISPYSGYGSPNPPLVRIVKDAWTTFSEVQKEILMFHELGHAMLFRQHTNEMLYDCSHYKSMMMDGDQFVVYSSETDEKRAYYIDELFNPFTPPPSWAGSPKTNKTSILNNTTTGWKFSSVNGATHTGNIESDSSFHIHSDAAGPGQSFWKLDVPSDNFPLGSTLSVSFQVKTASLTGSTASVTLQPDLDKNQNFWTSTTTYGSIDGTHDWTTLEINLNCYPSDKPQMYIYLGLAGGASGDVWFKDVSVDYYN